MSKNGSADRRAAGETDPGRKTEIKNAATPRGAS